jgi:hypothetical protein
VTVLILGIYGDKTAYLAAVQRLRGRLRQAWVAASCKDDDLLVNFCI